MFDLSLKTGGCNQFFPVPVSAFMQLKAQPPVHIEPCFWDMVVTPFLYKAQRFFFTAAVRKKLTVSGEKLKQEENKRTRDEACKGSKNGGYSQNGAGRGLRGTFAHGSMLDVWLVECGREKLTFGELLFAPFAWIRLGSYLQTVSVFEELEKSNQRKTWSKIFLFFRIDDKWAVWDSEQRTTLQTGLYSDTDCGCRRQATPSLGFCFPHRKRFTPGDLAVLALCLRLLAFVTVTIWRSHRVCQIFADLPDLPHTVHV